MSMTCASTVAECIGTDGTTNIQSFGDIEAPFDAEASTTTRYIHADWPQGQVHVPPSQHHPRRGRRRRNAVPSRLLARARLGGVLRLRHLPVQGEPCLAVLNTRRSLGRRGPG
ncbi:unnamed protein product, partial [Ectocarpus sp. 12 AP-2014]